MTKWPYRRRRHGRPHAPNFFELAAQRQLIERADRKLNEDRDAFFRHAIGVARGLRDLGGRAYRPALMVSGVLALACSVASFLVRRPTPLAPRLALTRPGFA